MGRPHSLCTTRPSRGGPFRAPYKASARGARPVGGASGKAAQQQKAQQQQDDERAAVGMTRDETGRPSAAVLVVIDGLSDISHATSLSRAHTPHLDMLARGGRVGLVDPVRPGLACGSDTAHLSLFGYDPFACYRGRGAFEAMGAGVEMLAGDVAFKCNLAVVDDGGVVTTRCAGTGAEMERVGRWVAKRLDGVRVCGFDDVEVHVKHAGFHRCVVRLRGPGLSDAVSDTDPLGDGRPLRRARGRSRAGERTAAAVNATSARFREVLGAAAWAGGGPRCNVVLFRGAAERIGVERFDRRTACRAFLIAPCKIIRGVGETVGLDYVRPPGATGGFDTDLRSKARACVDMLMRRGGRGASWAYHLGVVHVKAADEAVRLGRALRRGARGFCLLRP